MKENKLEVKPNETTGEFQSDSKPELPNKITNKINCFYNSKFEPCTFTTTESKAMEKHYRKEHYKKEVCHG